MVELTVAELKMDEGQPVALKMAERPASASVCPNAGRCMLAGRPGGCAAHPLSAVPAAPACHSRRRVAGRAHLGLLAALAAGVLAVGGGVLAMPQFRLQAIVQLHYDKLDPLWQYSGKVMSCTFCHVNKQGGAPWNVFGQALKKGFAADPKANFGDVLYTVLRANGDSDGDGYPDAIEVFAHTLPGDPASHPDKPLAELQQAFDAAGGVKMYAPKKGSTDDSSDTGDDN